MTIDEVMRMIRDNEFMRSDDARCRIRAALESLAAQGEPLGAGWQTIDTAPRDGTAVLVMRDIWPGSDTGHAEDCNGHNTYVAAWWEAEGEGAWMCYMDAQEDPRCPVEPTHWMPLPAPPSEAAPAAPVAQEQAQGGPVAWGQIGMMNGRYYLREKYDRTPYPPPADVARNLCLVPLYTNPPSADAEIARLRDALDEIEATTQELVVQKIAQRALRGE